MLRAFLLVVSAQAVAGNAGNWKTEIQGKSMVDDKCLNGFPIYILKFY